MLSDQTLSSSLTSPRWSILCKTLN
ncbi:hypothetical protein BOH78_4836 [Pichia kudriavzevii]|uniref:Uncharacterized protein n=1 Tax=Pichia kudriavzevii TaxID=4909 RepID=A0A1V2LG65_PICKU|nr:hypothetical protein BOH78_4836 [Pichia kudriavzevii]